MNHLLRAHAPISEKSWEQIDAEARARIAPQLAARTLVDFAGPLGWEYSATNLGRTEPLASSPAPGAHGLRRVVQPLIEIRADFAVSREELRNIDRGADDADFDALDNAAHEIALAENIAVFHGWEPAFGGIADRSPLSQGPLQTDVERYPGFVAAAVGELRSRGVCGPYTLALGPETFRLVEQTAEHGGYPLFEHLEKIVGGALVFAPGLQGGLVISRRGGDYRLECGQDLSVGYDSHDADQVHLYLQESISFHVATPEAAVALRP
jgi:uncharacterized linocin/CFP29 family protein